MDNTFGTPSSVIDKSIDQHPVITTKEIGIEATVSPNVTIEDLNRSYTEQM